MRRSTRHFWASLIGAILAGLIGGSAAAQSIRVSPASVNVGSQTGTVHLLTFGPMAGFAPADACWCGEVTSAAPDAGQRCDPATIFGCLPSRYDQSVASGIGGFTDIMAIPPSVVRRAYQAAEQGATSSFFYVRRFVSPSLGPDQYVPVSCLLTGGGARTVFSFNNVTVAFESRDTVLVVRKGEKLPPVKAELQYTGTGRLMGRWEIVQPGDELPADEDLLTGATLPYEARTAQRRYLQIGTFSVFLPPVGTYTLPGPDPVRLPSVLPGQYLLLLRIECTDDREGDSDLAAVGVGPGVIHAGAVAGFPMPVLRYFVAGSDEVAGNAGAGLAPADRSVILTRPLVFTWPPLSRDAALYRLEVMAESGEEVLAALVPPGVGAYQAPPWLERDSGTQPIQWRVVALDANGDPVGETERRSLRFARRPR
ncbi:MAG: hypothetical protein ACOY3Y_04520 [Acidobacteriota bacterium]